MIFWCARRFRAPPTMPWHALWPWSKAVHNLNPIPDRPLPPSDPPQPDCAHKYVLAGVVYSTPPYTRPGSGAYDRIYEDHYFCERCLDQQYLNKRTHGNTYEHPLPGTLPK